MSRVKAGLVTRTRHKKIIKRAKGFYGRRKKILLKLQTKLLKKLDNMLTEIGK